MHCTFLNLKQETDSRVIFFLGDVSKKGKNIRMNGNIFVPRGILRIVICFVAKAELGALFLDIKEGKVFQLALSKLGHRQPPTPVHDNNSTAVGIADDTVKNNDHGRRKCDFSGSQTKR